MASGRSPRGSADPNVALFGGARVRHRPRNLPLLPLLRLPLSCAPPHAPTPPRPAARVRRSAAPSARSGGAHRQLCQHAVERTPAPARDDARVPHPLVGLEAIGPTANCFADLLVRVGIG